MVGWAELTPTQRDAAGLHDRNIVLTAGAGTGKTTTMALRYLQLLRDDPGLSPEDILTITFTNRAAAELRDRVRNEVVDYVREEGGAADYGRWRAVLDELDTAYIQTIDSLCARLLREHITEAPVEPGFDVLDEADAGLLRRSTVREYLAEEASDDPELDLLARLFNRYADPRGELADILDELLAEGAAARGWAEAVAGLTPGEYVERLFRRLEEVEPELAAFDGPTARELLADDGVQEAFATLLDLRDADLAVADGVKGIGSLRGELGRVAERVAAADVTEADGITCRLLCGRLMPTLTSNSGTLYGSSHWVVGTQAEWESEEAAYGRYREALDVLLERFRPHEAGLRSTPSGRDVNTARYVIALARVTLAVGARYEERKSERGVLDFDDLIGGALRLLEESPRVGEQLRDGFEHLMVDEAQDTDPRQWRLVRELGSTEEAYDRRNVFAVGDRKQSIYRFRGADVATFVDVAGRIEAANPTGLPEGEGDLAAGLRLNFRSLQGVLEPLNALFDATFVEEADEPFEARPQPLAADRDDPAGVCRGLEYVLVPTADELRRVRLGPGHPLGTEEAENLTVPDIEAVAVAATIEDMLAAGTEVYPEADAPDTDDDRPPGPRPATYGDITILIRDRTWLSGYERALREYDVPYTVSSGVGFWETPEVTTLVNLLRVVVDPTDDVALYGLLRSPMFGLEDRRLAGPAAGGDIWAAIDDAEDDELSRAAEAIEAWRGRAGLGDGPSTVGSWSAYVADIVELTGFDVSMAGGPRGEQALANVEKFKGQLQAWSEDGTHGIVALLRRLDRRREQGAREAQADVIGHDDRVQLMTVHGAKGEEFPIVIVPGVGRTFRDRPSVGGGKVEFERVGPDRVPMLGVKAPDPDAGHRLADTTARSVVGRRRSAEERAEEKRTLYVACTRARDQLVLVGSHDSADIEAGIGGIEEADREAAGSWRDWVQDVLLDPETLAELNRRNSVEGTLGHIDERYAEVGYTVRLPPAVFPEEATTGALELPPLEIEGLPAGEGREFRLKPSSVPELLGDPFGEARVAADGRTIVYESPDAYDGEVTVGEADGTGGRLAPNVFGDIVHKLAELRPPEGGDRWRDVAEQQLLTMDGPEEIPDEELERIRLHARRAIEFVEGYEAGLDIEQVYDELTVTCRYEDGELRGDIDHLIVTPDTYHIVDYKTGSVSPETVEQKAASLQRQLAVYAIALHQSDPDRAVHATLCLTGLEDESLRGQTTRYSPAGLDALERSYHGELWGALEALLEA